LLELSEKTKKSIVFKNIPDKLKKMLFPIKESNVELISKQIVQWGPSFNYFRRRTEHCKIGEQNKKTTIFSSRLPDAEYQRPKTNPLCLRCRQANNRAAECRNLASTDLKQKAIAAVNLLVKESKLQESKKTYALTNTTKEKYDINVRTENLKN
jgi:hypothetical protein